MPIAQKKVTRTQFLNKLIELKVMLEHFDEIHDIKDMLEIFIDLSIKSVGSPQFRDKVRKPTGNCQDNSKLHLAK